jgi:hypothetical protein
MILLSSYKKHYGESWLRQFLCVFLALDETLLDVQSKMEDCVVLDVCLRFLSFCSVRRASVIKVSIHSGLLESQCADLVVVLHTLEVHVKTSWTLGSSMQLTLHSQRQVLSTSRDEQANRSLSTTTFHEQVPHVCYARI